MSAWFLNFRHSMREFELEENYNNTLKHLKKKLKFA